MKKLLFLLMATGIMLASCKNGGNNNLKLTGAGSSFAKPIYTKMFDEYSKKTGVSTNYQGGGSGVGISSLLSKTIDFGGTDAVMTDQELAKAKAEIVHIPTCIGAVVFSYNLPGVAKLKLTPSMIVGIFLGKIKKWNDTAITKENAGVNLPGTDINVVFRDGGSGTSFIVTDYLSKVSPEFKEKIGVTKQPKFTVGQGAKENAGVATAIQQTPGAIGYVELIYAAQNKMAIADVKNAAGHYITPSLQSASAAASIDIPADTRISITNSPAADAYPVSSFTWIILYKDQKYDNRTKEKAAALVNSIWWAIHDGQQYCEPRQFAKLSDKAVLAAEGVIKSINYGGESLLTQQPAK